jgi:hypothetical protein
MEREEASCFKYFSSKLRYDTRSAFLISYLHFRVGGYTKCLGSLLPLESQIKFFNPLKVKNERKFFSF